MTHYLYSSAFRARVQHADLSGESRRRLPVLRIRMGFWQLRSIIAAFCLTTSFLEALMPSEIAEVESIL